FIVSLGLISASADVQPELRPAEYFLGSWRCVQTTSHGTRTETWNNSLALNDRWIHMHGEGPPHRAGAAPIISEIYIGYNPVYRRFAMVTVNNYGGYWLSESKGWDGDHWIWTDTTTEDNIWGVTEIIRISTTHYQMVVKTHKLNAPLTIAARVDCNKATS
ncbi:MAG: hypothetical protein M3362_12735, partial [Acidobacteriota bacterium]|nr:hypothetical protein [Acidobacteriota bacterium]